VYGTLAALKRMVPRNRGVIIQVGSALAYRGIPLQSAYCAAKHAVQGFHDSLRTELLHDRGPRHDGEFDRRAKHASVQWWVNRHRTVLTIGALTGWRLGGGDAARPGNAVQSQYVGKAACRPA
jgi:short chain dehydrogenase